MDYKVGGPKMGILSPKNKYIVNQVILQNLMTPATRSHMKDFSKHFSKKYLDLNSIFFNMDDNDNEDFDWSPNNKEKALSTQTIQNFYYSEFHCILKRQLIHETLPVGAILRKEYGLDPLLLTDGVYIDKKILL